MQSSPILPLPVQQRACKTNGPIIRLQQAAVTVFEELPTMEALFVALSEMAKACCWKERWCSNSRAASDCTQYLLGPSAEST